MIGLAGWFSPVPLDLLSTQLRGMLPADPGAYVAEGDGRAGLGAHDEALPYSVVSVERLHLAYLGHPRLSDATVGGSDPVALARHLWTHFDQGLARVGGDFALACWDSSRRRGLVATDRIGIRPLFYAEAAGGLRFASSLDTLTALPDADQRLSPQALFDYLYFHVCPGPATVRQGIRRLDAGHCLVFHDDKLEQPRPYWRIRFEDDRRAPFGELKDRFVHVLEDSVRDATGDVPSGCFLSGGTDSSTVTGMLARVGGKPPRAFSIGFDAAGYDEMDFARTAARHFGAEHYEYYVTPDDVVRALPQIARAYDQPFGNASAIPTYYCARFAREHGVTRLLAGDGGDELFGGNERYAKQQVLSHYHRLPAALRNGLIDPLTRLPLFVLPLLRKLRSYVEQASPGMPQRYESYNLLNYLGAENLLAPEFLAQVDRGHPQALMREAYAPYAGASLINQLLGIDLRFTLTDSDLPKVTRMCALAGVDVAFPLLDERVIDFSATLAPEFKLKGTQLRWFFKEALRDFLPEQVIAKQKHGFGLPVGAWLVEHRPLFELARDAIHSLAPHRIVRPQFVDELLGPRLQQHAKYFGTMVWVLMMLGLWLDARTSAR